MLTREEAEAFIHRQLDEGGNTESDLYIKETCHHYGRMELKQLLDQIYGDKEGE